MISVITTSIRPNGLERVRRGLLKQSFKRFEWLVELNSTGEVDFNAANNNALKRAKGSLIVFIQDYIEPPPEGLQMFWDAHSRYKDSFFTAPVGKIQGDDIKWDWRTEREEIDWKEWEIDYGAARKEHLFNIGGFDEALDEYWGFDNVNVGLRAELGGYKFRCLPRNKAVAIDHEAIEPHPFRELRNPNFHNERLQDIRMGNWKSYI